MKTRLFTNGLLPCALASVLAVVGCHDAVEAPTQPAARSQQTQPTITSRTVPLLRRDDRTFRDLNKNGRLDAYEDWRLPVERRIDDLLVRMSPAEKVGMMLISTIRMGRDDNDKPDGSLNEDDIWYTHNLFTRTELDAPMLVVPATTEGILDRHLTRFVVREDVNVRLLSTWLNDMQMIAERTRLGIPLLFASNPRNHYSHNHATGLSVGADDFSKWPGTLGLAATGDPALVEEFGRLAAQEWVAAGIRKGYQYMGDLATEPRWQRIEGTFGEDADLAAEMLAAITRGFQGETLGPHSVAMTTKHFPGGGPQLKGKDPHFHWGMDQVYPGNNMDYHLQPFQAAIDVGTAAVMPYYAVPRGTAHEEVAFAYNKGIITGLLREEMGFAGVINSDTGIIFMMPWNVEHLSLQQRYIKALDAGIDLFSGTADPSLLLQTVDSNAVSMQRIDESVARLLRVQFLLGLFESPFVDTERAAQIVGRPHIQEKSALAQRKSIVLLRNDQQLLPIRAGKKVYLQGFDSGLIESAWDVTFVSDPAQADLAVVRVEPDPGNYLFEASADDIDLRLSQLKVDIDRLNELKRQLPLVLSINFNGPWVIEEVEAGVPAILANFGVSDAALLDVLTGKFAPTGKLPLTIPRSMQSVRQQLEDVPHDLADPLFEYGSGLTFDG